MARVEENYQAHVKKMNAAGNITSAEMHYLVFDAGDEDEALRAALAAAPSVYGAAKLSSAEIDERCSEDTYRVNVTYGGDDGGEQSGGDDDDPEPEMSFDCGGGTMHIVHAISQKKVKGDLDAGGLIGWNGKSGGEMEIAGVDVPAAQLRETYTKVMNSSKISTAYKKTVAGLVGKVNSNKFKGWNRGECMFLGMSYSAPAKGSRKITVTYSFAIQLNESQRIGGTKVEKKGFEYVWAISHSEAGHGPAPAVVTDNIYVAQVCEEANFSVLGI